MAWRDGDLRSPAGRHARIEIAASTCAGSRAAVDLLAHLADDGRELAWPVKLADPSEAGSLMSTEECQATPGS